MEDKNAKNLKQGKQEAGPLTSALPPRGTGRGSGLKVSVSSYVDCQVPITPQDQLYPEAVRSAGTWLAVSHSAPILEGDMSSADCPKTISINCLGTCLGVMLEESAEGSRVLGGECAKGTSALLRQRLYEAAMFKTENEWPKEASAWTVRPRPSPEVSCRLTKEQRLEAEGADEVIPARDQLDFALISHLKEK